MHPDRCPNPNCARKEADLKRFQRKDPEFRVRCLRALAGAARLQPWKLSGRGGSRLDKKHRTAHTLSRVGTLGVWMLERIVLF